jgi:quercetin dioxygenase-like cupin family protein
LEFTLATLRSRLAAAKGVACHSVSQDGQEERCAAPAERAVIVATFPMPAGSVFDWHTHPEH